MPGARAGAVEREGGRAAAPPRLRRSPTAEGVFAAEAGRRGRAAAFALDSAGTGAWHAGEPPDPRAVRAAAARGVDISAQRARQVRAADFDAFDHILAMDRSNLRDLERLRPARGGAALSLMLSHAEPPPESLDVPDPYYGGADGFETVLDLLERASRGLMARLDAEG
ncbi:MAG: low molecular weight protein-tyrosine-phosphatase [Pseudomonadota bacterium]